MSRLEARRVVRVDPVKSTELLARSERTVLAQGYKPEDRTEIFNPTLFSAAEPSPAPPFPTSEDQVILSYYFLQATNLSRDGPPAEVQRSTAPASPTEPDRRRSLESSLLNFPSLMPEPELSPLHKLRNHLGGHRSPSTAPQSSASEENSANNGKLTIDRVHLKRSLHPGHLRIGSDSEVGLHPSSIHATNGDTSPRSMRFVFPRSRSPSHPRSRAASPLRFIQAISAGLHQHIHPHHQEPEERFVPINPFNSNISFDFKKWSPFGAKSKKREADIELAEGSARSASGSDTSDSTVGARNCDEILMISSARDCVKHANVFLLDVLPRLIYLSLLLRLPALYFSRVIRVFREAEVSRPDIERMVEVGQYCVLPSAFDNQDDVVFGPGIPSSQDGIPDVGRDKKGDETRHHGARGGIGAAAATSGRGARSVTECTVTPAMRRFKLSWEMFIDSLLREWKTLNVVSALLASAILTIFQIPDAAADPVTRSTAVVSLVCSLMSLTYGCMYIVRFGAMRSLLRASKWAEEARRTNTMILWNVWVLLAMPAVWLAWSMLTFIVSILTFVWRTGSASDPSPRPPLSEIAILGPRIVITFLVFIGFLYLYLIIRTLKSYGIHAGRSESILTSPQARLGVLGDVHRHPRPRVQAMTPRERPRSILGISQTRSNEILEEAFERRGRERAKSDSVKHGKRREERMTERIHRSVSRRDGQ